MAEASGPIVLRLVLRSGYRQVECRLAGAIVRRNTTIQKMPKRPE
jgi:hypothetical protein